MLPNPSHLSGNSLTVRRFKNQLMKEFERQGLRNKRVQVIKLRPLYAGCITDWMRDLMNNKDDQRYVKDVINDTSLVGSGWQIDRMSPERNSYGNPYMEVTLRYRATADESLHAAAK
jgi:hypothetical protein